MADWEAHNLLQGTEGKMQGHRNSRPLDLARCVSAPCTVKVNYYIQEQK